MISLIAAHDLDRVIGKNNDLPWHIAEDLKQFKDITTGHPVIMGRNTFRSIYDRLGKPLLERQNIVISSHVLKIENVETVNSLNEAIERADDSDEVFIIGGSRVYNDALAEDLVDRMYITLVNAHIPGGDAYFPFYDDASWRLIEQRDSSNDEHSYSFLTYDRVRK